MANHTPGPWAARLNGADYDVGLARADGYLGENDQAFATVHENYVLEIGAEITDANAALIAAAPDLLVAAESALQVMSAHAVHAPATIRAIEAAIAKAIGTPVAGGDER